METPIKPYNDQCREHMIKSGMWDIFSFLDPRNKEKTWDLFINQYIFPLDDVKLYNGV